jgi:hypothetical protein
MNPYLFTIDGVMVKVNRKLNEGYIAQKVYEKTYINEDDESIIQLLSDD